MKHLQKQKEGKKRLRAMSIGNVELPQEAFSAVRVLLHGRPRLTLASRFSAWTAA